MDVLRRFFAAFRAVRGGHEGCYVTLELGDPRTYRKAARSLFRRAGGKETEITVRESTGFLTRLAKNVVHQNGVRRECRVAIRVTERGRSSRVEFAAPDLDTLAEAFGRACALVKAQEEEARERSLPLLGPQNYRSIRDFDPAVERESPASGAKKLRKILLKLHARREEASGYYSARIRNVFVANSAGLEAFHRASACRFGLTVRKDGGIGYASAFRVAASGLDLDAVYKEARARMEASRPDVRLKPGYHTVILAPRAGAEFFGPLWEDMNLRKVRDGDSFFSGKLGRRLFSGAVTVTDDVYDPAQSGLPFDGEGVPRKKILLIERGAVRNAVCDRKAACDFGSKATGHGAGGLATATLPMNVVMEPGERPLDSLLEDFEEALVFPHLWYHQVVQASTLLATGFVKGKALVWRKGRFIGGVRHPRYVQSIPRALENAAAVTLERETIKDREYGASVLPFLCVREFRMV